MDNDKIKIYAAIGYIPIVGWIVPYFLKKNDDFCQFHGRQSAVLSLIFIVLMTMIWLMNNLPILSHILSWIGITSNILPAITYISTVLFIGVSAYAAYKAFDEEQWDIPFIEKVREFLVKLFEHKATKKTGEESEEA